MRVPDIVHVSVGGDDRRMLPVRLRDRHDFEALQDRVRHPDRPSDVQFYFFDDRGRAIRVSSASQLSLALTMLPSQRREGNGHLCLHLLDRKLIATPRDFDAPPTLDAVGAEPPPPPTQHDVGEPTRPAPIAPAPTVEPRPAPTAVRSALLSASSWAMLARLAAGPPLNSARQLEDVLASATRQYGRPVASYPVLRRAVDAMPAASASAFFTSLLPFVARLAQSDALDTPLLTASSTATLSRATAAALLAHAFLCTLAGSPLAWFSFEALFTGASLTGPLQVADACAKVNALLFYFSQLQARSSRADRAIRVELRVDDRPPWTPALVRRSCNRRVRSRRVPPDQRLVDSSAPVQVGAGRLAPSALASVDADDARFCEQPELLAVLALLPGGRLPRRACIAITGAERFVRTANASGLRLVALVDDRSFADRTIVFAGGAPVQVQLPTMGFESRLEHSQLSKYVCAFAMAPPGSTIAIDLPAHDVEFLVEVAAAACSGVQLDFHQDRFGCRLSTGLSQYVLGDARHLMSADLVAFLFWYNHSMGDVTNELHAFLRRQQQQQQQQQ